jgi:hypothetical protein
MAYFDVVWGNLPEGLLEKTAKTLRIIWLRTEIRIQAFRLRNKSATLSAVLGGVNRWLPWDLLVTSIFTIVQLYFWLTTVLFIRLCIILLYDFTSTVQAAYSNLSWSNSALSLWSSNSTLSIYQVSGHLQSDPFTFWEVVCKSELHQISCWAEYERPPSSDKIVNWIVSSSNLHWYAYRCSIFYVEVPESHTVLRN